MKLIASTLILLVISSFTAQGKEVSLSSVVCHALVEAPQFERVRSDLLNAQALSEKAKASLSSAVEMSSSYLERNFRLQELGGELTTFSSLNFPLPQLSEWNTTDGSIFLSKGFRYGTSVRGGVSYQNQNLMFGNFPEVDIHTGSLALQVSQDLWRNAFGSETRLLIESAAWEKRAVELQVDSETQGLLKDLQSQYGQVWLAWNLWKQARENEQANKDYYDIVKTMSQRGMADSPALMQSESSWISSRQATLQSFSVLEKELILLEQLASIDITEDSYDEGQFSLPPLKDWEKFCDEKKDFEKSLRVQTMKSQLQAAKLNHEISKDMSSPRLSLGVNVSNNVYNENRRGVVSDLTGQTYGMQYGGSLNLIVPLDDFESRGKQLQANSILLKLQASLQETVRAVHAQKKSLCLDIKMGLENKKLLVSKKGNDQKIADSLLERWRKGRVPFSEVLRARTDYYLSSQELSQLMLMQRKRMWELFLLWGEVWKIDGHCSEETRFGVN